MVPLIAAALKGSLRNSRCLQSPDPEAQIRQKSPGLQLRDSPWSMADLIVFGVFFALTVLLLPLTVIRVWHIFRPDLTYYGSDSDGSGTAARRNGSRDCGIHRVPDQNRARRCRSFETIHWYQKSPVQHRISDLVGATLAISVLVVSSFFPSGEPPPIETTALVDNSDVRICAIRYYRRSDVRGNHLSGLSCSKCCSDIRGPGTAVSVTAILFALLHLPQLWGNWAGVVLIFVVGYVLSFLSASAPTRSFRRSSFTRLTTGCFSASLR